MLGRLDARRHRLHGLPADRRSGVRRGQRPRRPRQGRGAVRLRCSPRCWPASCSRPATAPTAASSSRSPSTPTTTASRTSTSTAGFRGPPRLDSMTSTPEIPIDAATLPQGGQMPLLGFGTWQLKGDDAVTATAAALEVGYRHLDTATIYGNEGEVGRALADSACGPRRRLPHHEGEPPAGRQGARDDRGEPVPAPHRPGRPVADPLAGRRRPERLDVEGARRRPAGRPGPRDRGQQLLARDDRRARRGHRRQPGGQPDRVEPAALRRRRPRGAPQAGGAAGGLQRPARRHPRARRGHRHRQGPGPYAGAGRAALAPAARHRRDPEVPRARAGPLERRPRRLRARAPTTWPRSTPSAAPAS